MTLRHSEYVKRRWRVKLRVVVLGAGFGGLELSTILSESLADRLDLTLIDKSDSFVFGYSKLDVMFGRKTPDAVRLAYRNIVKPGMRFRQETITAIDPRARRVTTSGGTYDADVLVVAASGMTEGDWIPVNPKNLKTRFPGVYAIGDVTSVGTPKAGVFSEGAARVVAASLIAEVEGSEQPSAYAGAGSCYVEFGEDRVGRMDVDFLSGPSPTGSFMKPSVALAGEKQQFGSSRRARWFGL
jgi:NADH dehydrogenase FAD-containing subunit